MQAPPSEPAFGGRYQPEAVVGRGAVATVYRARDRETGEVVAVKVLSGTRAVDPETRARFMREARALSALAHPHVIAIRAVGRDGEVSWLAMDLAAGGSLRDRLDREGPLPAPEACRLGLEVLAGLSRAHGEGIVHRDIKPENVLVMADGRAVLADFGIAWLAEAGARLTTLDAMLGTLAFMAPEQRRDVRAAGVRSDLYGVGATLCAVLLERPPLDLFDAGRRAPLLAPLPPALGAVLDRALAREPRHRYPSAGAMAQALRRAADALQ